jgi:hypothetical protein
LLLVLSQILPVFWIFSRNYPEPEVLWSWRFSENWKWRLEQKFKQNLRTTQHWFFLSLAFVKCQKKNGSRVWSSWGVCGTQYFFREYFSHFVSTNFGLNLDLILPYFFKPNSRMLTTKINMSNVPCQPSSAMAAQSQTHFLAHWVTPYI